MFQYAAKGVWSLLSRVCYQSGHAPSKTENVLWNQGDKNNPWHIHANSWIYNLFSRAIFTNHKLLANFKKVDYQNIRVENNLQAPNSSNLKDDKSKDHEIEMCPKSKGCLVTEEKYLYPKFSAALGNIHRVLQFLFLAKQRTSSLTK